MSKHMQITTSEDAVRARAYEIWESEGRPMGRDFDHWRRSELEMSREAAVVASAKPKAPRAKAAPKRKVASGN